MKKHQIFFYYISYKALTVIGFTVAMNELFIQEEGIKVLAYFMILVGLGGSVLSTRLDIKKEVLFSKSSPLKELLVFVILVSFGVNILSIFNAFMQREYSLDMLFTSLGLFIVAISWYFFISKNEEK